MKFYDYFKHWHKSHHAGDTLTVEVRFKIGYTNTTEIPYDALEHAKWIKIIGNFNDHYHLMLASQNPMIRKPIAKIDAND